MKTTLFAAFGVIAWLAAVALFVFGCFAAASDAQGALIFLVIGPVAGLLWLTTMLIGLTSLTTTPSLARACAWLGGGGLAFLVAFVVSAMLPPLAFFPQAVVGAVASSYQAITGMSPYQAVRRKHDVAGMVRAELAASGGRRLDLTRLHTGWKWNRVCVLGPYTDDDSARALLEADKDWKLSQYNPRIARSDAISVLVLAEGRSVVYVIEQARSEADFAALSRQCFARASAVFERVPESSDPPVMRPVAAPR